MIVFLNGRFVPEEQAVISIFDRGFLYGDALFEAMLVTGGRPFRWEEHIQRLEQGVKVLKLALPSTPGELRVIAAQLIERNECPEAILRLSLSRGITARGYSPRNATNPVLAMTLHPAPKVNPLKPACWRVITSSFRLAANDPLARFKTANKLHHVLARAEADEANAEEALLLNTDGHLAESTTGNIFWVKNKEVHTPALPAGPLPGVTRGLVLGLCRELKIPAREILARPRALHQADGVFLTMTSQGVVQVESLDGARIPRSPLTRKLHAAYWALLRAA
jgi:aminodeoxychorismate lyase